MAESPFYFAWVDGDQTTFGPEMQVVDENVFSFTIKHDEGQIPTLDIEIKNPRVGLLSAGRKVWAWLGYKHPVLGPIPLFFGVLVGVPTNLFAELVTLSFIARAQNYLEQKQAVAETMKTQPYYDPIWLDDKHRDDPDAILEGWSKLWHVDRTTMAVTASDILTGEDGVETFTEDEAIYSSVQLKLGQAPLTNIRVVGTVNWTQRSMGVMQGPTVNVSSYTGETFMSDWPKPGASFGGGWKCATSFVYDTYHVAQTPQMNSQSNYTNPDKAPEQCTVISSEWSNSCPALLSPNPLSAEMTGRSNSGVCDPFADPPVNIPAHVESSGIIVPLWNLNCVMTLRYDAKRSFSEVAEFDVLMNTQSLLTSPLVQQNTELITISSADVGKPLIELDAWTDFAGQYVGLGQIIFPNDPTTPGGLSYQICVSAGIAGEVEPEFSDTPGFITADGAVQWASMGQSPLLDQPDWSPASFVPLGEIICYQEQTFDINSGDFVNVPGATSYYICTTPGETNSLYSTKTYIPVLTNSDEPTPAPVTISFIQRPLFTTNAGTHINDGSVVWTCIGQSPALLGLPIGGTPDNVTARSYFPSTRGQWSLQYLICKARARLRLRARAVTVSWDAPFDLCTGLSCRQNATIFDPRLPGAVASGKVISYSLKADGKTGKLIGHIEAGCSIGFGNSVPDITGTPEYTAASGYMQPGYQQYDGGTTALADGDISYTPPVFAPFDDGLTFPLYLNEVSDGGVISGNLSDQAAAITAAFEASRTLANLTSGLVITSTQNSGGTTQTGIASPDAAWAIEQTQVALGSQSVPYVMEAHPISWTMTLKPVTNGPFDGAYFIQTSALEVPKGIDLEALSSP